MADIPLDALTGGGEFKPSSFTISSIAPGVTGTLLTITAPAGKKVRLNGLTSSASQAGITVTVDGEVVVNALSLEPRAGTSGFCVGNMATPGGDGGVGSAGDGVNVIPYLWGYSTIVISKNAGNTASTIYYSFSEGN